MIWMGIDTGLAEGLGDQYEFRSLARLELCATTASAVLLPG